MLNITQCFVRQYDLQDAGTDVTFVKADEKGRIRYVRISKRQSGPRQRPSTTHGSNLTGTCWTSEESERWLTTTGFLYIVDASQTAGVFLIDGKTMHIDVLLLYGA